MKTKLAYLMVFIASFFSSLPAHADDYVLTVRQLPNAEYEAVITYDNTIYCFTDVNEPSSVEVIGAEVNIESPGNPVAPCIDPVPPIIVYEQTADIGALVPGSYTVSWNQPDAFSLSIPLTVEEGPNVPCVGCEDLIHAPFPETGAWYNPDQSGTGINLEIQNGFLVGYYYGYTAEGLPEWQIITGPLVRSEQEGLQWELETTLQYFQGGNCIGCEYQPPSEPSEGPAIKLEFLQRNYLRVTLGDNPSQFYVPILYGSLGMRYFEEQTPYVFPQYGDDTFFTLVLKPNTDPPTPESWEHLIVPVGIGKVASGGINEGRLTYKTWIPQSRPPGPDVFWDFIICELESESGQPGCKILQGDKEYIMPIANMSDSRIFGEAEDGSTIEGYRIGYD